MPFRFKLAEPFEEGCRRIAREQIERAQSQLKGSGDPVVAVHETRKSLKRLRALLRLIRPALGEDAYRAENAHVREIGRLLSSTRDRHVLIETIAKLEAAPGAARKSLCQAVRDVLNGSNGGESPMVDAAAIKQAQSRLAEAGKRFGRLRLSGKGFEIIGTGLEAGYRKARRAFHTAYVERTDESFHEWRKSTQQHWRHMALLSRAWTECIGARVAEARRLSQILGDDHDLALLCAFVRSERASAIGAERAGMVEKLAHQRQKELRVIAQPMGQRLFTEGARSLHRRMAAYWEAAIILKEHEPEVEEMRPKPERAPSAPRRRRSAAAQP